MSDDDLIRRSAVLAAKCAPKDGPFCAREWTCAACGCSRSSETTLCPAAIRSLPEAGKAETHAPNAEPVDKRLAALNATDAIVHRMFEMIRGGWSERDAMRDAIVLLAESNARLVAEGTRRVERSIAPVTIQTPPASPNPPRCNRCGWPLAASAEEGCVPGDCSYRPREPLPPPRTVAEALAEPHVCSTGPGGACLHPEHHPAPVPEKCATWPAAGRCLRCGGKAHLPMEVCPAPTTMDPATAKCATCGGAGKLVTQRSIGFEEYQTRCPPCRGTGRRA